MSQARFEELCMNYSANPGASWRVPARQRYYEHTLSEEKLKNRLEVQTGKRSKLQYKRLWIG